MPRRLLACASLPVLFALSLLLALAAQAQDVVETVQGSAETRFHGLPLGEWRTIEGWEPARVVLDCGDAVAQDACQWRDVTDGAPLERAVEDAMRWLAAEGIHSPDLLGPVVETETDGLSALTVFSRTLDDALASERSCDDRQDNLRALALYFHFAPADFQNMAAPEDGHDALQLSAQTGSPGGAIASPPWQMQGLAVHELAHAVQDSAMLTAAGFTDTCDTNNVYSRAKFLFEGLADFLKITLVRWHLSPDGNVSLQTRDATDPDLLSNGLSLWEFRKLHGWAFYSLGLFHDRNAYQTSSLFRHFAERFWDGKAALHNLFFDPDSLAYPGSEPDIVQWFAQVIEQNLTGDPFGPSLALAFADIGSWPGTSYDGRSRIMEIGFAEDSLWRDRLLGCRQFTLSVEEPTLTNAGGVGPYAGQCLEFLLDQKTHAQRLAHGELMIELRAPTLREADGMHLGLIQIMRCQAEDHLAAQSNSLDAPDLPPITVSSALSPAQPEPRLFSCAEALDRLPYLDARAACMPVRDGPIRQPDGSYAVRWTLPAPVTFESQTTSVVLVYAPTRDVPNVGQQPQESFVGGARARLTLTASLRTMADLDAPRSTLADMLATALNADEPAPPVTVCDETMPRTDVPEIQPITRGFGLGDWNRFDFPDDIRSDLNSALTRERMLEAGLPGVFPLATMTYVDDPEMVQTLGAFPLPDETASAIIDTVRDRADALIGFSVKINARGWCNGRTDDDTFGDGYDDRLYHAFFAEFSDDGFEVERQYPLWSELTPGATFDLAVNISTPTGLTPTGLGETYDRGRLHVLALGDDWVRVRLDLAGEVMPQRSFEAVLPFIDNYTWRSDRVVEETAMQQYYLARWKAEEMYERVQVPVDAMGRELPSSDPSEGSSGGASGGAGGTACACECPTDPTDAHAEPLDCPAACCETSDDPCVAAADDGFVPVYCLLREE